MSIDKLTEEDIYSNQLEPHRNIHSDKMVWTNKEYCYFILREHYNDDNYSVLGSCIAKPYQLLIPFKEYVNEYMENLQ